MRTYLQPNVHHAWQFSSAAYNLSAPHHRCALYSTRQPQWRVSCARADQSPSPRELVRSRYSLTVEEGHTHDFNNGWKQKHQQLLLLCANFQNLRFSLFTILSANVSPQKVHRPFDQLFWHRYLNLRKAGFRYGTWAGSHWLLEERKSRDCETSNRRLDPVARYHLHMCGVDKGLYAVKPRGERKLISAVHTWTWFFHTFRASSSYVTSVDVGTHACLHEYAMNRFVCVYRLVN